MVDIFNNDLLTVFLVNIFVVEPIWKKIQGRTTDDLNETNDNFALEY